ncbi:hypothetical protein ANO14919_127160 [Xylariales sp. No.14919]|nr:hypothetical protein ANO14919_127160 [Xylariales sp. No.14919]
MRRLCQYRSYVRRKKCMPTPQAKEGVSWDTPEAIEELKARLTEQRDGVMAVKRDLNSHQASVIDNDDYSSEEGNETRDIPSFSTAETSQNLGEVPCWTAQITEQQSVLPLTPLVGVENIQSGLLFTE